MIDLSTPHTDRVRRAATTGVLMLVDADLARDKERASRAEGPRRDYVLLADALRADVYDLASARSGRIGSLVSRLAGKGPAHALTAAGRFSSHDLVFSDNEYSGLFTALILRLMPHRPRHAVLAHHLTPRKKRLIARLARGGIDKLILHSEVQRDFAIDALGFAPERIEVVPYQVDTRFWAPQPARPEPRLIATAGLECRDYPTLIESVKGLDVDLSIAAASNWSRKRNTLRDVVLPFGVTVNSYDYPGLRDLYARSSIVVVPLLDVDFQAGITTVLEGMSMGKPVVSTYTKGHQQAFNGPVWQAAWQSWPDGGVPYDDASGIYVPPADAPALRSALSFLLRNPGVAARMGRNARRQVEANFSVEQFASRMATAINSTKRS